SRALADGSVLYIAPHAAIAGRPFMTASTVLVPTETSLSTIDLSNGLRLKTFDWPDGEGPGNVLATADHIVIAQGRQISVYTDLEGIRAKYAGASRADPPSVERRLTFAEMMFHARDFDAAGTLLDEAIDLLGGRAGMRPGPQRDRVFTDAITFAEKAGA